MFNLVRNTLLNDVSFLRAFFIIDNVHSKALKKCLVLHEALFALTINIEPLRKLEKSVSVTCDYKDRYHNARKSVALLSQATPER